MSFHRVAGLLLLAASMAAAQTAPVRLANGARVTGEVVKATPAGLEISTPPGPQTVPWEQLSAATRYRYQPGFRDAFPKVLAGEAVAITAPAEPTSPAPTEERPTAAPPGGAVSSSAPSTEKPATAPQPQKPAAAATRVFPEGTFKNPDRTLIFALTFSDNPADVLYVGGEFGGQGNARPEELLLWWPQRAPAEAPQPVRQIGAGIFPPLRWSGKRAGMDVEVELNISIRGAGRPTVQAEGYVNVRRPTGRSRYFVRNPEIKWAADNKPLVTTDFFGEPVVRARFTDGGRRMIAMVKVGNWDILPLQGAENQLTVEAVDSKGHSTERGRVKAEESVLKNKSEAWEHEFKRLKGGETYTIKASLPLGPVFGDATFEQTITAADMKF